MGRLPVHVQLGSPVAIKVLEAAEVPGAGQAVHSRGARGERAARRARVASPTSARPTAASQRHGAARGPGRRDADRRGCCSRSRARIISAGVRRARRGAREGHGPPRHQAGQPDGREHADRPVGEDPRLGIATAAPTEITDGCLTRTESVMGSPSYVAGAAAQRAMSTRAATSGRRRSLYEMVTGDRRRSRARRFGLAIQVATESHQSLSVTHVGIGTVIDRCLEKRPAELFSDVGAARGGAVAVLRRRHAACACSACSIVRSRRRRSATIPRAARACRPRARPTSRAAVAVAPAAAPQGVPAGAGAAIASSRRSWIPSTINAHERPTTSVPPAADEPSSPPICRRRPAADPPAASQTSTPPGLARRAGRHRLRHARHTGARSGSAATAFRRSIASRTCRSTRTATRSRTATWTRRRARNVPYDGLRLDADAHAHADPCRRHRPTGRSCRPDDPTCVRTQTRGLHVPLPVVPSFRRSL